MLYMDDAAGAVKGGNASVCRAYDDERLSTVVLKVSDERKGVLREEGCTKSTEAAPCSPDAMLRSEYDFLTLLAMRGCSCVPKPYALRTVYAPRRTEIHERACLEMQRLEGVTLADALVIDLLDALDALFDFRVVHAGAQRRREKVAVDKGLLVAEQDGLAAELDVIADRDGLHGRRGSLRQKGNSLFGHVRALGDLNRALGDLHAERHTCGAAALFTVLLGR